MLTFSWVFLLVQFGAGFGRGGTSLPFWDNVYGFDMSCIGKEIAEDAARVPMVDIVEPQDIVTESAMLHVSCRLILSILLMPKSEKPSRLLSDSTATLAMAAVLHARVLKWLLTMRPILF